MNTTHPFIEHADESPRSNRDLGNTATGDPERTAALYEEMNEAIARNGLTFGSSIGRLPERSLEKAA